MSYAKAASGKVIVNTPDTTVQPSSVLRMLCNYVGQDIFLKGVSMYLKDHLYGNTTTRDLWKGINEATRVTDGVTVDVSKMMENWIMEVHVEKFDVSARCSPRGWNRLDFRCSLSQKRKTESKCVKIATLKQVLPRRMMTKRSGVSLTLPPYLALFINPPA